MRKEWYFLAKKVDRTFLVKTFLVAPNKLLDISLSLLSPVHFLIPRIPEKGKKNVCSDEAGFEPLSALPIELEIF